MAAADHAEECSECFAAVGVLAVHEIGEQATLENYIEMCLWEQRQQTRARRTETQENRRAMKKGWISPCACHQPRTKTMKQRFL